MNSRIFLTVLWIGVLLPGMALPASAQSPPAADLFKQISSADWHNCGVRTNGTLVCWGNNDDGRVSNLPADANIPGTYTMVAAGNWHNCALRTTGSIACWGNNDDGRVTGAPTTGVFTYIEAGDRHTCAVRSDGHVICWGNNGFAFERSLPDDGLGGLHTVGRGAGKAGRIHVFAYLHGAGITLN